MLVFSGFPNDHNLIYRYKTYLAVVILEVKHAIFNFQHLTTQA